MGKFKPTQKEKCNIISHAWLIHRLHVVLTKYNQKSINQKKFQKLKFYIPVHYAIQLMQRSQGQVIINWALNPYVMGQLFPYTSFCEICLPKMQAVPPKQGKSQCA